MTTILVTNDDGVNAPGLKALYTALKELGKVIVVAPEREQSASSHSLTMHRPLRPISMGGDIYAVNGTPTDCVTIAVGKIIEETPSLVVSGVNNGGNLGDDVTYSGTVSAAIEGTILGIPSLAVSVAGEGNFNFETASFYASRVSERILKKGLPKGVLLNMNVPNVEYDKICGVKFTVQGKRVYDGSISETFDPWGRKHYWIGGGTPVWEAGDNTDFHAVERGFVSITPVRLDLTDYGALNYLKTEWRDFL